MMRIQTAALTATLMAAALVGAESADRWTAAVNQATQAAPEARVIVLDLHQGRVLAAHRLEQAARTLAAPGSTLKPLILYDLLAAGRWNPERRIACTRALAIAGHRLACSHPQAPPFDARNALAWSCNTYFAEVARALQPGELAALLRSTGLLGTTGLARDEATAQFRDPHTTADVQLTFLGVENIRITPLELATAYRRLAEEIAAHRDTAAATIVQSGLADSTEFGMAQPAGQGVVSVAGKTGTAESTGSHLTHGWFAGFAPAVNPEVVIVVYLPSGRGADAAHIAGLLLAHAPFQPAKAKLP
jgi:cell division protein FtsI/penicillin-binding protein 2